MSFLKILKSFMSKISGLKSLVKVTKLLKIEKKRTFSMILTSKGCIIWLMISKKERGGIRKNVNG